MPCLAGITLVWDFPPSQPEAAGPAGHPHGRGDGVVDSAEFALEAIRFPYRQVFGGTAHPVQDLQDVFRPTVFIEAKPDEKTVAATERFRTGLA